MTEILRAFGPILLFMLSPLSIPVVAAVCGALHDRVVRQP